MSLKHPPLTLITGQQSPFSPIIGGQNSSPMMKSLGEPTPILWFRALPVHVEHVFATKLQLANRDAGKGFIYILGLGKVKVMKSERGSAKNAGKSEGQKSTRRTEQLVSSEPH